MVIASQQLQQPGTRLLLFLVYQEENLQMKHKRRSELLLFLAHMSRWIICITFFSFLFFSFFFCLFLVLELVFVFKFNIYIWWFLTGEMGKKSLHCISLLWSDCFLSWQSFIRMFTEVIFDCSCIQAVSLLLPSMPCLQNPNLSRSKTGHHGSWALMYAKLYLIVTITLHLLLTPVHCLSIVSKCFQANVYSIWMGLFYLLLKRLYSLEQ